ncbi:MAG: mannose-6-phosphate isomerase, class I [Myxococcota bacterium]
MPVLALHNPVMQYAWGGTDALSTWTGVSNPDGQPQAELWLGAHPRAPSRIDGAQGPRLDAYLREHPSALGSRLETLPFLMKVLAARRPLSIQCHPSQEEAERGFALEQAQGLALDDPKRNYKDPFAKPEMVVALSSFRALEGFRAPSAVVEDLVRFQIEVPDPLQWGADPIAFMLDMLLGAAPEDAARLLTALLSRSDPDLQSLRDIHAHHPGEAGCLAAVFLNQVVLEPGEALFLGPRRLHAYLEGVAVEVMGNSDNVLRGGLTPKHIDPDAVRQTVERSASPPQRVKPSPTGPWTDYPAETTAFMLDVGQPEQRLAGPRQMGVPEILFSPLGRMELEADDGPITVESPAGLFVGADVSSYRLKSTRSVFRCTTGR